MNASREARTAPREFLEGVLARCLTRPARDWLAGAQREIESGIDLARFTGLLSLASRHAPRGALSPTEAELAQANEVCEGWNPERWTALDAVRVALVLARRDLGASTGAAALEDAFRFADVGELCALYRSLCLLPAGERFVWRAGEGCRSSMRAVFEAAACDTPFPFRHFDRAAWRQLVIKCVFIEAPLWRVFGLDQRLDAELARMALDLADERRSAGRPVPPELWLCLGRHGGERGIAALERELSTQRELSTERELSTASPAGSPSVTLARRAAGLALARAGDLARLRTWLARERDPGVSETMKRALDGHVQQGAYKEFAGTPAEQH